MPVKTARTGPAISHLLFADDVLLFTRVIASQAHSIRLVIDHFCHASGMSFNIDKSKAMVGKSVNKQTKDNIRATLGILFTNDIRKYLGVPLVTDRCKKLAYKFVIERLDSRLLGWKSKLLNMAGCCTLVQSTITAIPLYTMQIAWLPSRVCDIIDQMARNFL